MKAWILTQQAPVEERPLTLADLPDPQPGEHEIRIKVSYAGICRTDIHIAEGDLPLVKSPIILGHEVVGTVDKVGSSVTNFRIGERAGAYWLHSACGHCKYCRSGQENYCPDFKATGWHADGGFAEYTLVPDAFAISLESVQLEPPKIPPLLCPGIAGYAAFKLTEVQSGESLGLYGFGPTAYYVLKVAQSLNIHTYVSSRSSENIERARQAGAKWAADTSQDEMPVDLDAAILFPPAGNLVEPILAHVKPGGNLVLAPVSSSPIRIENYSENLWGRTIDTLYQLKRSDAEEFIGLVNDLDLHLGIHLFPFEKLDEAIILAKQGKLEQPNAVIEVNA
ncbi:MAG TPA: alcohol dehydrogenase catalytic domain-containing protein [Anaerolineae bacterium]|nr:alcohol dehydrogenase catalytic domain-containing protein [Anaerolineae bacterium]